jgi:DnaJ family protein C protein 7
MVKRYYSACADCAESLELEKGNAKVLLRQAKCELALGNPERAITLYSEVLAEDPGNSVARTEKASAQVAYKTICEVRGAVAEGNAARVAELTGGTLLDKCPGSTFLRLQRGNALLTVGRVDEALKLSEDLVRDDDSGGGGISSFLLLRARCLFYQGNGNSALKTLQECLRQDPDDPAAAKLVKQIKRAEALKKEGNDAYSAEKWDLALESYRAALALDPANKKFCALLLCNCAAVLLKQDKPGESVGECNASIEADETYVKAYIRRGEAYIAMGDLDSVGSAIRDYNKAKELLGGAAPSGGGGGAGRGSSSSSAPAPSEENKALLKQVEEKLKNAQKALKKAKFKDYYKILGVR